MADEKFKVTSDILSLRVESGKIFLPDKIASTILNMYPTQEGTLRSLWGPSPYVPDYSDGQGEIVDLAYPTSVGRMRGVFHGLLGEGGEREIFLVSHESVTTDGQLVVRVLDGWAARTTGVWRYLLGPASDSPQLETNIICDNRAVPPTQFEVTSKGIIIIPQEEGSTSYIYDGEVVLPLGYQRTPGPPIGLGPTCSVKTAENDVGYSFDANNAVTVDFHQGRVGFVASNLHADKGGKLLSGNYRGAIQWLNRWGDVSPLSGHSNLIHFVEEDSGTNPPDTRLKYVCWQGIEPGPDGTVGRILCRTRDTKNSGLLDLFEVPPNAAFGTLAYSTLPDNVSTVYPDNAPDSWLLVEPLDAMSVSPFRYYRVAMGVGWAANFEGAPGKIVPSVPARWGTFLEDTEIYPDPSAREITGLAPIGGGMLAFTELSTFFVERNAEGDGYRVAPVNPSIGCVAPSSIASQPDGSVIWLGREGFYQYVAGKINLISSPIEPTIRRLNRARFVKACAAFDPRTKEYRCWVPTEGSLTNNVCLIYDGQGWRKRSDVLADSVCVTRDHRQHMVVAGSVTNVEGTNTNGVWVLDHANSSFTPGSREAVVETAWLGALGSMRRGSPVTIYLWLRESEDTTLTVEVFRDWRAKLVETMTAKVYPPDDIPPFWDSVLLGAEDAEGDNLTWVQRRPYWTKVDIFLPSAEVFKLKFSSSKSWEFVGMAFQEVPRGDTMRIPK